MDAFPGFPLQMKCSFTLIDILTEKAAEIGALKIAIISVADRYHYLESGAS